MSRDNAPIGNTCPSIDAIIGTMEQAKDEAVYIHNNAEGDFLDSANEIIFQLEQAIKEMENIRDANSLLREWGNEQYERADEIQEKLDDALRDIEYLEFEQ
jgi:hypothetical protein